MLLRERVCVLGGGGGGGGGGTPDPQDPPPPPPTSLSNKTVLQFDLRLGCFEKVVKSCKGGKNKKNNKSFSCSFSVKAVLITNCLKKKKLCL